MNKASFFRKLCGTLFCLAAALTLLFCLTGCGALPAQADVQPAAVQRTPAPTATPSPSPAPTASPSPSPTPAPTPFTLAWMCDTQIYASSHPEIFTCMTKWVAEARQRENILFLIHTGDIVNASFREEQLVRAAESFSHLPPDLPVLSLCGNHDKGLDYEDFSVYLATRPDTHIDPDRAILDGLSYYTTLEAGGMKILLLSISYLAERKSIDWALEVCRAHPDHYVILCTHSYLQANGAFTSSGKYLEPGLTVHADNLRMVLCGHISGVHYRVLSRDGMANVHEMLFNLQSEEKGGNGFLRLLRFDPAADSVTVTTYSPYLDVYGFPGDPFGASYTIKEAGLADYIVKSK